MAKPKLVCEECHEFKDGVNWSPTLKIYCCDSCFTGSRA